MDTGLKRRGHRNKTIAGTLPDSTPRKKCRFCKGLFTPNPNQARHDFCQPSCRKDFYKYGAFPAAKFKADILKRITAEITPLRARLEVIEDRLTEVRGETSRLNAREIMRSGGGA